MLDWIFAAKDCPRLEEVISFIETRHNVNLKIQWKRKLWMRFLRASGAYNTRTGEIVLDPEISLWGLLHEVEHKRLGHHTSNKMLLQLTLAITPLFCLSLLVNAFLPFSGVLLNVFWALLVSFKVVPFLQRKIEKEADAYVEKDMPEILEKLCLHCEAWKNVTQYCCYHQEAKRNEAKQSEHY